MLELFFFLIVGIILGVVFGLATSFVFWIINQLYKINGIELTSPIIKSTVFNFVILISILIYVSKGCNSGEFGGIVIIFVQPFFVIGFLSVGVLVGRLIKKDIL